jgi:hypothetical protein
VKRLWSTSTESGQGAVYRDFIPTFPCFTAPTLLAVTPPNCDLWDPSADNQFAHLPQAFAPDVEIDAYAYDNRFVSFVGIPEDPVFVDLWYHLNPAQQYDVFLAASFCYCPGEGVTRPGLVIGRPRFPNVSTLQFLRIQPPTTMPPAVDPWHPFKGRMKTSTSVEIGYQRPYTPADCVTILDPADATKSFQLQTVEDAVARTITGLSGNGYLYYELRRDNVGGWTFDTVGGQIKNSVRVLPANPGWPPHPDDRGGIPLLLGTYTNAGTDNATWRQSLRENPYIWPRPMQPDFFPIYYYDDMTSKSMVKVSAGYLRFRTTPNSEFRTGEQTMDISLIRYYYIEVIFNIGSRGVISATQKIDTSFPGYYTAPDKIRYLIGKTDGTCYWPYTIGTIYEGTGYPPKWTAVDDKYLDAQGVKVWAGDVVAVAGEEAVADPPLNSSFMAIRKQGLHWQNGDLDLNEEFAEVKVGGSNRDVDDSATPTAHPQPFLSGVNSSSDLCSSHKLKFSLRTMHIKHTCGLTVFCEMANGTDVEYSLVEQDVVTDIQVSGVNLQYKKRKLWVLCADTPGDWANWHVGTNCP